jgi:hypothetical protein
MSATYPTPTLDRATLNFDPVADTDAVRKGYVTAATGAYLPLVGGTVTGLTKFGTNTAAATAAMNGQAGVVRPFKWQTAGVDRFTVQANTNVETGVSNAGSNLDWLSHGDDGTSLGVFLRINRATGAWTFDPSGVFTSGNLTNPWVWTQNNTIAMRHNTTLTSGTGINFGGASPAAIWQDITWSGTLDTGASPASPNFIRVKDAIVAPSIAVCGMLLDHEMNTGYNGNRYTLQLKTNKNASTATGNSSNVQLALFYSAFAGEGGTVGNYLGGHCVLNADCQIATGAAEQIVACQENDIRLQSGSNAQIKTILKLHYGNGDAAHGAADDAALAIHGSPTIAAGTGNGLTAIALGQANQAWPLDPNAAGTAIMQVRPNTFGNLTSAWKPIADLGFDLSMASFTSFAWKSAGLSIDGAGQMPILGPGAITYSNNGLKLAAPNVRSVSATIASGGTAGTYHTGDIIRDVMGSLWTVTAAAGNVTAVALLQKGYASAAPTNPVATVGGGGTGCTLNLTTAATGELNLSDTGQKLGFFGATAVVKPTVTGSKGANAALASLLTALANFGLLTDSST